MLNQLLLPSIWLADFHGKSDFDAAFNRLPKVGEALDAIDDRILQSRHPFSITAYCAACCEITSMLISWHYGRAGADGSVHPAWTETAVCSGCGLNSRMRAVVDFLSNRIKPEKHARIYIAETTTPAYKFISKKFSKVVGSEYLGPNHKPGETSIVVKGHFLVRHEDLTQLSFQNHAFDFVITQDVFEHVPDYHRAFIEIARVLAPGGKLVFTIPFFYDQEKTRIRASIKPDGTVEHHLPPEIHGNPVSGEGSLCFQNFGWDILSTLATTGFTDVTASLYWGPWQGHLGLSFFVFSAAKT